MKQGKYLELVELNEGFYTEGEEVEKKVTDELNGTLHKDGKKEDGKKEGRQTDRS